MAIEQVKLMENHLQNLIGKWGWISIDEIKSDNFKKYLHPQTETIVNSLNLSDFVFQCVGKDGDFLKLKSSEVDLVVKSEVFRIMPEQPKFKPLEMVKFYNSKNLLEFGIIKNINWHNKENKHIYLIEVNGKLKGRRYFAEDLESNKNLKKSSGINRYFF